MLDNTLDIQSIRDWIDQISSLPFWEVWKTINELPPDTSEDECFMRWLHGYLGMESTKSWDEVGIRYVDLHVKIRPPSGKERAYLAASLNLPADTSWAELIAIDEIRSRRPENEEVAQANFQEAIVSGVIFSMNIPMFDCVPTTSLHARIAMQWWLDRQLKHLVWEDRQIRSAQC